LGSLIVLAAAGAFAYHWVKISRAERFATAGDSLAKAGKLNAHSKTISSCSRGWMRWPFFSTGTTSIRF